MMITILLIKEKCKIFPAWLYGAKICFSINCQAHNVVSAVMESLYSNTWMSVKNHIVSARHNKYISRTNNMCVFFFFLWIQIGQNCRITHRTCIINALLTQESVLCCCTDIKQTVSRVWQWFKGLLARMIKRPCGSKTTRKQKKHTHTGR